MTSDETTTNALNFNLPGIGVVTDWASQYRANFQALDDYLSGTNQVPAMDLAELQGPVAGGGTIGNLVGQNLSVDDSGTLNASETTGTADAIAHSRRRVTTPVGGA